MTPQLTPQLMPQLTAHCHDTAARTGRWRRNHEDFLLGLGSGGETTAGTARTTTRWVLCGAVVVATGLPEAQCGCSLATPSRALCSARGPALSSRFPRAVQHAAPIYDL